MTATAQPNPSRLLTPWRLVGWGGALALLAVPTLARWPWGLTGTLIVGIMFAVVGGIIELAVAKARTPAHGAAAAIALLTGFALQWIGRVGAADTGHLENFIYVVVALMALAGAVGARFRAEGLAWAMFLAGGFQLLVALAAYAAGWVFTEARGPVAELGFNLGLALPWLLAGGLFRAKAEAAGE